MKKDKLRFFKRLKRFDLAYFQRKVYDRKMLKTMESKRDIARLSARLGISPSYVEQKMQEFEEEIAPFYKDYVTTTSTEIMAMSFELSKFILSLCEITKPRKILDLGSGFSSFCFRYWIKNYSPESEVLSVDDEVQWLDKTRGFLSRNNVADNHLITWEDLTNGDYGQFDLVFYDFGTFPVRKSSLNKVIDYLAHSGILVLDDMHSADYGLHVKKIIRQRALQSYSLRRYTNDKFTRYAHLAINTQQC